MSRRIAWLAALPLTWACADHHPTATHPDPVSFTVVAPTGTDLGLPPGADASLATSVNSAGTVGGYATTGGTDQGFRWTPSGGYEPLPVAPSRVNGVNGSGIAVGSLRAGTFTRAFRWSGQGAVDTLPPASVNPLDVAHGVNDLGHIVGSARYLVATGPSVFQVHATRWVTGPVERILIPGAVNSVALAVSGTGQVVGYWTDADATTRAFSWTSAGGLVEIPRPAAYTIAVAAAVNGAGQVTGYFRNTTNTETRAFVWSEADGMSLLPLAYSTFSYAIGYAINGAGDVAGAVRADDGAFHAAVFRDGAWIDLEVGSSANSVARAVNAGLTVVGAAGGVARAWSLAATPDGAGQVTGGGWFDAPADACPGGCRGGRATFGLVAEWDGVSASPRGNTTLRVQASGFRFRSTSYTLMSVTGDLARYQGNGEVDGRPGYAFAVTAVAGSRGRAGGGLRLRVTDAVSGAVVWDSRPDAPASADAVTPLGGGSIHVRPY